MFPTPRGAERVAVDAFVKVHGAEDEQLVFRTRDLSEHGLFLYTQVARIYPIKVGSSLQLELDGAGQAVACTVVVVRVVEPGTDEAAKFPTGFGVRITECDDVGRSALATMVRRIKSGEIY
jgi:hypothetical protein